MSAQEGTRKELQKEVAEEKAEIGQLKERIAELEESLLRHLAEFENYRKQLDREKEEFMRCANERLIIEILDVADNFERALPELRKKDPEGAAGMEMIYRQLMKTLEKFGVRSIEAAGKKFDPYDHEAFMQQETEGPDGMVLEELQKGYRLNDKVIRHAKVKVSKGRCPDSV